MLYRTKTNFSGRKSYGCKQPTFNWQKSNKNQTDIIVNGTKAKYYTDESDFEGYSRPTQQSKLKNQRRPVPASQKVNASSNL